MQDLTDANSHENGLNGPEPQKFALVNHTESGSWLAKSNRRWPKTGVADVLEWGNLGPCVEVQHPEVMHLLLLVRHLLLEAMHLFLIASCYYQ